MVQETTNLESTTYKLKAPGITEHAIYFTIAGKPDPVMFFLNSKEMESFQWIIALMTSYSRQIEARIPISGIIDDMKKTFDPGGSYIIPDGTGREVHSVVHHLGLILDQHIQETN